MFRIEREIQDKSNLWSLSDTGNLEFSYKDDILAEYQNLFKTIFGDINIDESTPQGQIITSLTQVDLATISYLENLANAFFFGGSGEFLDNDVNSERTYFSNVVFEDSTLIDKPHFELAINLYEVVYDRINSFLNNYLQPMIEIRDDQIISYIENYCPQYKYLIKYASDELKNISYSIASNLPIRVMSS